MNIKVNKEELLKELYLNIECAKYKFDLDRALGKALGYYRISIITENEFDKISKMIDVRNEEESIKKASI